MQIKVNCFLGALFVALATSAYASDLVPLGSTWRYRLGTNEASAPINAWRQIGFNDAPWGTGGAPIGYDTGGTPGTAPIVTTLPDPRTGGNPAWTNTYFRKVFSVAQPANITDLALTVYVDDGAVAWLNGVEILRANVPAGELTYLATASGAAETLTVTTITNIASLLVAGNNVLAVHVFNGPAASSDFVFEAILTATEDQAPTLLALDPPPSATVQALASVNVIFNENVTGVDAGDLLINGVAASSVVQNNPRDYTFNFPQPPNGTVTVAWIADPGIVDIDNLPNAFVPGPGWSYTLDPNAIPSAAIISEFMADNENGIRDEDGNRGDWIEIYNPGLVTLNLDGWFLTDTPVNTNAASITNLTKWRFPSVNLPPNRYLLVWADNKDRRNPSAPLHTNFRLGNNAGGYLALVDPRTNVISAFSNYVAQAADISYGRDRVDPNLLGYFITPTPGAQNAASGSSLAPDPVFSLETGIYTNNSLTLTITAPAGTTIRFTLDASEPTNNSPLYTGPIAFTTNMVIKARVFSSTPNVWPSRVGARSFILLDSSARDFNSNLPLLIISTQGRPVGQQTGAIFVRPRGTFVSIDTVRGRSSLQGKTEFQELGAFEIVGQTSAGFPKQPVRIEVNDELGNDKDVSILGLPSESDWNLRNPHNDKGMMNDFLAYELWEQMGHYSCRRRFVELFFDTGGGKLTYPGDYYGVMVLFEHIERGDDRVDIAQLTPAHTNEPSITGGYIFKKDKDSPGDLNFATAGGTIGGNTWPAEGLKMHEPKPNDLRTTPGGATLTPSGSNQLNYLRTYLNRMEAALYAANWTNATGTNHYSHYMDVDAFVDQQLHVEFTKQIDGYRLSDYFSKDRNGKVKPEPVWDWNLAFGNADYLQGGKTNGWYWNLQGEGMTANEHIWLRRLVYGLPNITTTAPWTSANGPGDPNFRQKITDRWAVLRTNVLNGDRIIARVNQLEAQLVEAAARNWSKYPNVLNVHQWPNPEGPPAFDVKYSQPTSAAIVSEIRRWINGRYIWMDNQFLPSPILAVNGGPITPGFALSIFTPSGSIYYTTNGTDPRAAGGGISPGATLYTGPVVLAGNARVVARALTAANTPLWTPWSAPVADTFVVETPKLVITEIMYHPPPSPPGLSTNEEEFEYIEVKNVGTTSLNLNGATIGGGVEFTFPPGTILAAGQRVLVVKNQAAFVSRYGGGFNIAGQYTGSLANEGNRLILQGPVGEPLLDFSYDDAWYPITDGFGFSLVIVDENAPASAWGDKANWRPSGILNGTPGQGDGAAPSFPRVVVNEALTHSDPAPPYDTIELRNLDGSPADISGWYLTDDYREPKKFRIPNSTVIPANDFLLFDETAFNVGPSNTFSLSSSGDEVYLFSGDEDGNLSGYVHGFEFGAQLNGVTFGRHVISTGEEHFVAQTAATLGAANSALKIGPIVISEIMYRPPDVLANGGYWNNSEDEYIELRNITGFPVNLSHSTYPSNTWRLDKAVQFSFPSNTTIAANSYVLVVNFNPITDTAQRNAFRAKYGLTPATPLFGPYSGDLSNGDESVALYQPDNPETSGNNAGQVPYVLVEEVHYSDQAPWPGTPDGYGQSLHRVDLNAYSDDPSNWAAGGPTAAAPYVSGPSPVITANPDDQSVGDSGVETATFSAGAIGQGPLSYQWLYNGDIRNGATNSTLVIQNVKPADAGQYQCMVLNPYGSALSSAGTLTVRIAPKITQNPVDQRVPEGTNVTFQVVGTTVVPPLRYQWRRNGESIPGATNSFLQLNNVISDVHDGSYSAVLTDNNGTITSSAGTLLVLLAPTIVQPNPAGQWLQLTAVAGDNVTLGTRIRGTKPIFLRWRKFGQAPSLLIDHSNLTANTDFVILTNVTASSAAAYAIIMTNAAGGSLGVARTNAVLTVLADANGNHIADIWESGYFPGGGADADPGADPDGDGMSNQAEYIAGTDPTNPTSYLKVDDIAATGGALITFQAVSNRTYTVEYKDGLNTVLWSRLTDVAPRNVDWIATVVDPTPSADRYYRLATPRRQ